MKNILFFNNSIYVIYKIFTGFYFKEKYYKIIYIKLELKNVSKLFLNNLILQNITRFYFREKYYKII